MSVERGSRVGLSCWASAVAGGALHQVGVAVGVQDGRGVLIGLGVFVGRGEGWTVLGVGVKFGSVWARLLTVLVAI